MHKPIFSGIYRQYNEANQHAQGDGFSAPEAIERAVDKLKTLRSRSSSTMLIGLRSSTLPALLVGLDHQHPLSVLDFGGSVGFGYQTVVSCCPNLSIERYDIVEAPAICDAGSSIFPIADPINFFTQTPIDVTWDIIYLNSCIQYIDEYEALLKTLGKRCRFLLIDDLPSGKIPDFVSLQTYYDSLIPHRFFSLENFIALSVNSGIELRYQNTYLGAILGKIQGYPMNNLPKEYRIQFSSTLLFNSGTE
jgi:putative methyltransferase (TIGR04325 family)